jgi:hypothetical protein
VDETARAYATLGVAPGAPLDEVRKRYRALVRQWHPDRFARDPQGQAEAAIRMRAINDAFRCVAAGTMVPPAAPGPPSRPHEPGRRLTREEIDRMVESLGNEGPLDWLFASSPFAGDGAIGRPALAAGMAIGPAGICALLVGLAGASEAATVVVGGAGWVVAYVVFLRRLPPR